MADNYCNNCGKHGHSYNQCKLPITSLGSIAFRICENKIEYLMICRKDTLGFIDFMRGKYTLTNKDYIMNMLKQMTNAEKHKLNTCTFDELWHDIWGNVNAINQYKTEENSSRNKFNHLKQGVQYKANKFSLSEMIEESKQYTIWDEPEWGFPKGRRNFNESDLDCALREFNEETGIDTKSIKLIENLFPFEEIFTGSNYKSYKHKYYLAVNKFDVSNNFFQKSEVGDMKWLTLEESLKMIRPYSFEKIEIIKKVDKLLNKYSLLV